CRILSRHYVVVWRVALDVLVILDIIGVAPLFVLIDREWNRLVEHGRQRVHERHLSDGAGEELGTLVEHRADQEAPGAPTPNGKVIRVCVTTNNQLLRGGDEVVEGVGLLQELPILVPLPAELSPTSDVGDCETESPVEEAEPRGVEHGIAWDLVCAVAVKQRWIGSVQLN